MAQKLLWSEVLQLPLELPFARRVELPQGLGDAEVEDARRAVRPDENVLR